MDGPTRWAMVLDGVHRHEQALLDLPEHHEMLVAAVTLSLSSIPGTLGCSVTQIQDDGRFATPVSDGALALELDAVQYRIGDGPCLTAVRTGERQRIRSLPTDRRWPQFTVPAMTLGVLSSLSIPLLAPHPVAALNFYGASQDLYASQEFDAIAGLIARITGVLLAGHAGKKNLITTGQRKRSDAADRAVIATAQQVVMDRYQLNEALAYRHLAVRSAEEGRTLADVARRTLGSADASAVGHEAVDES